MLAELHVQNLGIIDDATIVLAPGMTTITGETGAGKTLLVTALELALGGRAEGSAVRDGAGEARVEARLLGADGEEAVVARVVPREGRSRAYVDGRLATVAELASLGARHVELHGQRSHGGLLAADAQRGALDAYVGSEAATTSAELRAALDRVRASERELAELGGDPHERARELDLLRFQVEEIEAAGLGAPDEREALAREHELLTGALEHRRALTDAYGTVEHDVVDALGTATDRLDGDGPFAELAARLRGLQADASELARDLRVAAERIVDDPERLEQVEERRRVLAELVRKYGATLEEVAAYGVEARARLEHLATADARADELRGRLEPERAAAHDEARRLSALRRAAATPLARDVEALLPELALPQARLEIAMKETPLGEHGIDQVELGFSANRGEAVRPLVRVASGGELSRVLLALRVVLAGRQVPDDATLVFDEVDAGIGGAAGAAVGRALRRLSDHAQVLCVTHLAQVAAHAHQQLVVTKAPRDGRTVARVEQLLDDGRVAELSRMLAGDETSTHARGHAAELLDAARTGDRP